MITTLTGKNSFLIKTELTQNIHEYISQYSDLGLDIFDGVELDIDAVREAMHAMPFLADKKLVVVRDIAARKDIHDALIQILQNIPESTDVIIADEKLDKRGALYKVLSGFTMNEYNELSEPELLRWIQTAAADIHLDIDTRMARLLLQRAGENQWILANELQKLADSEEQVTETLLLDMVEEHPRETIFQLLDAIIQGKTTQALSIYSKLKQAQLDPHYTISMLVWQLHLLGYIVTKGERSIDQVARDAKASPYVLKKLASAQNRMTKQSYETMLDEVFAVDAEIKSAPVDADSAVEQLITKLATISS